MSELSDIRDALNRKAAIFESNEKENKIRAEKIKTLVASLDKKKLELLESQGYSVSELLSIDYDRLITDQEYNEYIKKTLETTMTPVLRDLKKIANV